MKPRNASAPEFPCGHPRTATNTRTSRGQNKGCAQCHRDRERLRADIKRGGAPPVRDLGIFPCGHPRSAENMRARKRECATCHRDKQRARYLADPQRHREAASAYQRRNRSAATRRQRAWHRANPERSRAYARAQHRLRRVARRDPDTLAYLDIIALDPCVYCGGPFAAVDHIHPSVRGGANHWTNYAPACAACNGSKHARELLHFLLARR